MSELDNRLMKCFSSVFPALRPDEIRAANAESVETWDSVTAVTLAAVVQEEFNIHIDLLNLPELDSFEAFRSLLVSGHPL